MHLDLHRQQHPRTARPRAPWFLSLLLFVALVGGGLSAVGTPPAAAEPGAATPTPWVTVLCKFADHPEEPQTPGWFRRLMTSNGAGQGGLYDYWRDNSGNSINLAGSSVRGWYRMDQTQAQWRVGGAGIEDRTVKIQRCIEKAVGVDFRPYYGIVVVTNAVGDLFGFRRQMTLNGTTRDWGIVATDTKSYDVTGIAHEMGHGFGLPHSYSTSRPGVVDRARETEYGDPFDIMSAYNVAAYKGTFSTSGPSLSATSREGAGWLPSSRTASFSTVGCAATCTRRFTIADQNTPGATGPQLVKVPFPDDPSRSYTIEYHSPTGWDRGIKEPVAPVVLIHERRTGPLTYLVTPPANPSGRWAAGQTFAPSNPAGLRIRVVSTAKQGSAVVDVTRPVSPSWERIGGRSTQLVATGRGVYARQAATSGGGAAKILRYDGTPGAWAEIGGSSADLVANNTNLFATPPDRSAVNMFDGWGWQRIGGRVQGLVAGGSSVYAIQTNTGNIARYDANGRWTVIGGPGAQFAANDTGLYAITPDRQAVMRYTGTPGSWTRIGGPATRLVTDSRTLYLSQPGTGNLLRWNGTAGSWATVGSAFHSYAGNADGLVGITADRQKVMRLVGTRWEQIGGPASELAAGSTFVYARNPVTGEVFQHSG